MLRLLVATANCNINCATGTNTALFTEEAAHYSNLRSRNLIVEGDYDLSFDEANVTRPKVVKTKRLERQFMEIG